MKKIIILSLLLFPLISHADDRASIPSWYWGCGDVTPDQCRQMLERRHGVEIAPEPVQPEPQKPAVVALPPQRPIVQSPPPQPKPQVQQRSKEARMADEVIRLTNNYRKSKGLRPLKVDPICWDAAFDHAKDMARTGTFDHVLNGQHPHHRYNRRAPPGKKKSMGEIGENIGEGSESTPASIFRSWILSPSHHEQLLDPNKTHMGAGVARGRCEGGGSCWIFTQCYSNLR